MNQRKKVFEFCFWIALLLIILYFSVFKPPKRIEIVEPTKLEIPNLYHVQ